MSHPSYTEMYTSLFRENFLSSPRDLRPFVFLVCFLSSFLAVWWTASSLHSGREMLKCMHRGLCIDCPIHQYIRKKVGAKSNPYK